MRSIATRAAAWNASPPGGKGRTILAIVSHMHNVRLMWLKAVGAEKIPDKVDRHDLTAQEAIAALQESCDAVAAVLSRSLKGEYSWMPKL